VKCPLKYTHYVDDKGRRRSRTGGCLEEDCAWWDASLGRCVVPVLSHLLDNLCAFMQRIESRMPHEAESSRR